MANENGRKVRYAVVGAGWISQEAFMPGIHSAPNSVMTAIVTGNVEKSRKLADFHGIEHVYTYDQYDEMLRAGVVDAVYIALPNSMHADFAIRAARAGVHALVEKPLAKTVAESEAMIAAAAENNTLLLTAYRLHNEPGAIEALEMIRRGEIGEPLYYTSVFSFQSAPVNHRLQAEHWGGPLQDIGVYCLNAVRHVFGSEPVEVVAMSEGPDSDARFAEIDAHVGAMLRFPGGKMATFYCSFGAGEIDKYTVVGSKGVIEVEQAFRFQAPRRIRLIKGDTVTVREFPFVEEFGGQAAYFSNCIINGERPEADGEEGLADMVTMVAIEEAIRTGKPQAINLPPRPRHPTPDMAHALPRNDRRLLL